jgi:diphthine synthase
MLTFVGLGLYDERSITVEGKEALQTADQVFAEFYTSKLVGADLQRLEYYHDVSFEILDRAAVEQDPEAVLEAAESEDVAFVTAGDTMISTTHVDLRLRAHERGVRTRIVHGTTAQTAASSLTGLQNYRFGKATTLPFPDAHGGGDVPESVVETIEDNRKRNLHTLVYLDIKVDDPHWEGEQEFMHAGDAAALLSETFGDHLGVVVARAGSANPVVEADRIDNLAEMDFGRPLHLLIVPGELHDMERDALEELADAPGEAV